jgi:hypothetical protein
VTGQADLQGRKDVSGVTITAINSGSGATTVTNATAGFTLSLAPGVYAITAARPQYLPATMPGVVVASSNTVPLPLAILRAGDVDNNGAIGQLDLTRLGASFGKPASADPNADLNGDGAINILDLCLVGGNYGKSGPQPW